MKRANHERLFAPLIGEGFLAIDETGRIWRKKVRRGFGIHIPPKPRRAEYRNSRGYLMVVFRFKGQSVQCLAHRLVWQYCFGDIPADVEINHIDGDKTNNHPSNLELLTASGNVKHAFLLGFRASGEAHPNAKLRDEDVVCIRQRRSRGEKLRDIAADYPVGVSCVGMICQGLAR